MARRAVKSVSDPFTPIISEAEWDEKGWARESEPLTASPQLGAMISIRLDPDGASLVRRAARLMGMSKAEFVQRAAIKAAAETVDRNER